MPTEPVVATLPRLRSCVHACKEHMHPNTYESWGYNPICGVYRHCSISGCSVSPLIDVRGGGPMNKEDLLCSLLLDVFSLPSSTTLGGLDERAIEASGRRVLLKDSR